MAHTNRFQQMTNDELKMAIESMTTETDAESINDALISVLDRLLETGDRKTADRMLDRIEVAVCEIKEKRTA